MTDVAEVWRRIIVGPGKSWVAFDHGTCVVLPAPEPGCDLRAAALDILKEWGPVAVGCSAGDFSVIRLRNHPGFVVTSHHPDLLTYVGPGEAGEAAEDVTVGLLGRCRRDQDAADLTVVHVEDRRRAG